MSTVKKRGNRGAIITAIVALGGAAAVVTAFMTSASPYGTFTDAERTHEKRVHVAGDLVKDSISTDLGQGTLSFKMKDKAGRAMTVVYNGTPPANLAEATEVVAIGGVTGGQFHSHKLLVKCPSKYENGDKPQ
jgi:cytochrome c-type biogenesis protein CcmE